MTRRRGFTLVEILVALAIVAVALAAGMRALAQAADSATALKARTLALWVAQNRLAAAQIATPWPALGNYTRRRHAGGRALRVARAITTTPNPAFRRIEISVAEPQAPGLHDRAPGRLHRQPASRDHERARECARGFTLVEVLLALAIFGVIACLRTARTSALTDGEARLVGGSAALAHARSAVHAIRGGHPAGSAAQRARGAAREPAWLAHRRRRGQSALVFTRAGSEFSVEPGPAGQRIGYRLRDGTVEIAYWPQLDNAADAQPAVYPLVDGVAGFQLAYLTRDGAWRDTLAAAGRGGRPARGAVDPDARRRRARSSAGSCCDDDHADAAPR